MSIERNDSQQTTCNATAIIDGERRQVASAIVNIHPGKTLNITVMLQAERTQLQDADFAEIAEMFAGYLAEEIRKANGLGIPVGVLALAQGQGEATLGDSHESPALSDAEASDSMALPVT